MRAFKNDQDFLKWQVEVLAMACMAQPERELQTVACRWVRHYGKRFRNYYDSQKKRKDEV